MLIMCVLHENINNTKVGSFLITIRTTVETRCGSIQYWIVDNTLTILLLGCFQILNPRYAATTLVYAVFVVGVSGVVVVVVVVVVVGVVVVVKSRWCCRCCWWVCGCYLCTSRI